MKIIKFLLLCFLLQAIIQAQVNQEWIHFNSGNSGLPSNTIQALAVDSNNVIWIGTPNGLAKYMDGKWQIFNTTNALVNNNITAVTVDNNNNVWIIDSVLSFYDGNNWYHFEIPKRDYLPVYSRVLAVDSSNTLWMLNTVKLSSGESTNGIISFKDSEFKIYDWSTTGIDLRGTNCIAVKDNEVWVGGYSKLRLFSNGVWKDCTWDTISQSFIRPVITDIDFDNEGNKWIAGYYPMGNIDAGWDELHLYRLTDDNKYYDYPFAIEIPDQQASVLKVDSKNNRWLGVYWGGLLKLSEDTSTIFNTNNSDILANHIGIIAIDKNNNKWLAGDYNWYNQGVSVFREGGVILTTNDNFFEKIPASFKLFQNYPNPFNPSTTIEFNIPASSNVKLNVYNLLGQLITTLIDENLSAGNHKVIFNGSDYPSGVYFYEMISGYYKSTKKFIYLK